MIYRVVCVSHGDGRGDHERLYLVGDEPGGYRTSYRVFPKDASYVRENAVAGCPTLEAASAARRLLQGDCR